MHFQIYSKDNCPHCRRAVALLTQRNISFEELKLDEDYNREELLEMFPQAKTFPQIVIIDSNDEKTHVGGADQLQAFLVRNSKNLS